MKALEFWTAPSLFPRTMLEDLFSVDPMPQSFSPEWGLEETEKYFKLTVDLPGMKKSDINIEVENDHLVISGERKHVDRSEKDGRSYSHRCYGQFRKSFKLGDGIKLDEIQAGYSDGVLEIVLQKTEKVQPRKIAVADDRLKLPH